MCPRSDQIKSGAEILHTQKDFLRIYESVRKGYRPTMDVHLCASIFGCQPKSRLRGLISPVIINRRIPWPSLKRRHSRWSVRETRRRGQRFLIFGGDEIILFALTWRETESISWDCFLICSEKCISRPLWLHLSRPEWLCRQFSIIRRVIICCIIGQHG